MQLNKNQYQSIIVNYKKYINIYIYAYKNINGNIVVFLKNNNEMNWKHCWYLLLKKIFKKTHTGMFPIQIEIINY